MPQISEREIKRVPLRVPRFLAAVPTARRLDGRPAKPARRDNARRVFTRRERPNLHAHAGRPRAAGPTSSYWTPLRVRQPTRAASRRRSTGCLIVYCIDANGQKVCNLHGAKRPLIKGVLLAPATRMLLATRRNPAAGHGRRLI